MHDCLQTQDNLVDLLFDELDGATHARLLAEVGACVVCSAQYRSLAETLDVCDDASAVAMPHESYWPQYHAALSRRLHNAAVAVVQPESVPLWKRLVTTTIRVPAPLAVTVTLLLLATSILALSLLARSAPEPVVLTAPGSPQGEAAPQIKFIEVPVVQEKIITQTIYVPRRNDGNHGGNTAARQNLAGIRRPDAPAAQADAPLPRENLSGFKPAGEVNLRIIKESNAREQ